ncbi:hypothetical protein GCM10010401_06420 [Rarobacter faecitabidus]|uniref:PIN domain-containing protein n=1 Tax=Rarobacter faecitabidus TaxID=13243 RepID=A0A542ZTC3_RARFA|nr:type II toxin-antitoxin system VapC family toxin [Rarobacter faecitabidus]TQL63608.1 PIN domain-containing protein [Rarobacter faecitabidus]
MALVYFDSAAILSLIVESPRTRLARRLWHGADLIATAHVARVQVPAALAQARRAGLIGEAGLDSSLATWRGVLDASYVLEAGPDLSDRAAGLVLEHDLRSDDAWHLAAAEKLLSGGGIGALWDERLSRAVAELGLRNVH